LAISNSGRALSYLKTDPTGSAQQAGTPAAGDRKYRNDQVSAEQSAKTPRITVGTVVIYLSGVLLVGSSIAKFVAPPAVVAELANLGFYGGRLTLIAVLESISALLFLVPKTRTLGLLLVSAYMGGAIATHIQHGQSPLRPALVLMLFWAGVLLCRPEFFSALGRNGLANPGSAQ